MTRCNAFLIAGFAILAIFFTACGSISPTPGISIDSRFREFYDLQGGESRLGKAISQVYYQDGMQYQVTENAIMIFQASAPTGEQFNFWPLANNFVQEDSAITEYEQYGVRFLNGHIIYDEFVSMYDRIGGVRFAGNPITEVRVNYEQSRYEQYFEKLGFYRSFSEPNDNVHLLPYGLMECQRNKNLICYAGLDNAIPLDLPPQPFLPVVRRLGETFVGQPLSQVYLAPDNKLEQIYENVVLAVDPANMRLVTLRHLPSLVGITAQSAVAPRNEPGLSFWQKSEGIGYNVPNAFLEYIADHGGMELAGEPITELFEANGVRRQCFTSYCIDYDSKAPSGLQIRPTALGYDYQRLQGFTTPDLQLRVWEQDTIIAPGKIQVVGVLVYNETPSFPITDVQPTLRLFFHGEETQQFVFPATSSGGTSYLKIPVENMIGLVEYEVCVSWPGKSPVCTKESWIVK